MENNFNEFTEFKQKMVDGLKLYVEYIDVLRDHTYAAQKEIECAMTKDEIIEIAGELEKCVERITKKVAQTGV